MIDPFVPLKAQINTPDRVLYWLLLHPFQCADDIAIAWHLHPTTIQRVLHVLLEEKQIESLISSFGVCYYLIQKGLTRIAARIGLPANALACQWKVDERGLLRYLPRLPLFHRIGSMINTMVQDLPRAFPGSDQWNWHWMHDYRIRFEYKGKEKKAQSDAVVVFSRHKGADTQYFPFLILADPGYYGEQDHHRIQKKLEALLSLRESATRLPYYQIFPPLLVLTPSLAQMTLWQRIARETALRFRTEPLLGAIVVLPEKMQASAWQCSWQYLASLSDCPFRELFLPVSRDALLPDVLAPYAGSSSLSRKNVTHHSIRGQLQQRLPGLAKKHPALLLGSLKPRYVRILQGIYAHPYISQEELTAFLYLEKRTLATYLSQLLPYIEKEATLFGRRLRLSERGWQLLQSSYSQSTRVSDSIIRPLSRHTKGIYSFLRCFAEYANKRNAIFFWEYGVRCMVRYQLAGRWKQIFPDAFLSYQKGERSALAWLEWDEGNMRDQALAQKFAAYNEATLSGEWRDNYRILPTLLLVTKNSTQEQRCMMLAKRYLSEGRCLTTTAPRLTAQGLESRIWQTSSCRGDVSERVSWPDLLVSR